MSLNINQMEEDEIFITFETNNNFFKKICSVF